MNLRSEIRQLREDLGAAEPEQRHAYVDYDETGRVPLRYWPITRSGVRKAVPIPAGGELPEDVVVLGGVAAPCSFGDL